MPTGATARYKSDVIYYSKIQSCPWSPRACAAQSEPPRYFPDLGGGSDGLAASHLLRGAIFLNKIIERSDFRSKFQSYYCSLMLRVSVCSSVHGDKAVLSCFCGD